MAHSPEELAQLKRAIYEKLKPRRRRFIDKMGYDAWDPFQEPNDPLDMREDASRRTSQQLVAEFLATQPGASSEFGKGAWEVCAGVMSGSEKHRGMYAFCKWYKELLAREGIDAELGPTK
ncbi:MULTISPECIES: hypothetical protein [Solidesulfovibrio]|uniref:hypothetical protein n=1 Tax=Solidesulfovibrio TaxID=2910984 RepID=UPI000495C47B|nr:MULTISPECIES: hypothetical protein [Solidesulfovibrio]MEA5087520.1 hypothetical protein [Solidesulfovibrio sp.]HCR11760.1 hypothetical protein [Desulfovibrio sp.]HML60493.1 hypothetical protein [Solidesulfovibrio sp.]